MGCRVYFPGEIRVYVIGSEFGASLGRKLGLGKEASHDARPQETAKGRRPTFFYLIFSRLIAEGKNQISTNKIVKRFYSWGTFTSFETS